MPNFSNEANDMINEFIHMYQSLDAHYNLRLVRPISFPKVKLENENFDCLITIYDLLEGL